jgi:hypothetical protein
MTAGTVHSDHDAQRLMELINGFWISQAIHVAVTLSIPDLLRDGALPCVELASLTGSNPAALYRLLRALAALGILHEGEDRHFSLTPVGEGLTSGKEGSCNTWARFVARPPLWAAWGGLLHSVRTGEAAFRCAHGQDVWSFRASHPEEGAIFDLAMHHTSERIARELLAAYDFTPFRHITDVGGGNGALLASVLAACPHATATLLDLPQVTAGAGAVLEKAGVGGRCKVVSGSFFDGVPAGGDLYLLKSILHDWEDREALHILRSCRLAMHADGRLLIIERLIAPPNEGAEAKLSDLNMLVNPGGRERTHKEFAVLAAGAAFTLNAITPLLSSRFAIEAVPSRQL